MHRGCLAGRSLALVIGIVYRLVSGSRSEDTHITLDA